MAYAVVRPRARQVSLIPGDQGRMLAGLHRDGAVCLRCIGVLLDRVGSRVGPAAYRPVTAEVVRQASELYARDRVSVQAVADVLGVSRATLYRRLRRAGVPLRQPGGRGRQ